MTDHAGDTVAEVVMARPVEAPGDKKGDPTRRRCPDAGTCHHECADDAVCWRVKNAGPLSIYAEDWSRSEAPGDTGAHVHRALALVERALRSKADCDAVNLQTGGSAPELVQGILDGITNLYARPGDTEALREVVAEMDDLIPRTKDGDVNSGTCDVRDHQ